MIQQYWYDWLKKQEAYQYRMRCLIVKYNSKSHSNGSLNPRFVRKFDWRLGSSAAGMLVKFHMLCKEPIVRTLNAAERSEVAETCR